MEGILVVVCDFLAQAAIIATVIGVMTRLINFWVRAWQGKEDIF